MEGFGGMRWERLEYEEGARRVAPAILQGRWRHREEGRTIITPSLWNDAARK